MDAFEELVAQILWNDGYWVQTSFKVNLDKSEKRAIGKPSSPRWEVDVIAYSGRDNLLKIVECKSYLDSRGVCFSSFDGSDSKSANRYKLFCNEHLRSIVLNKLKLELIESGACPEGVQAQLCLACGRIATESDRQKLREYFEIKGWGLFDEVWLRERLERMSNSSYENQVSSVVSKLLLRHKGR